MGTAKRSMNGAPRGRTRRSGGARSARSGAEEVGWEAPVIGAVTAREAAEAHGVENRTPEAQAGAGHPSEGPDGQDGFNVGLEPRRAQPEPDGAAPLPGPMPEGWLTVQSPESVAQPAGGTSSMPMSPSDQDGMYRGLLWAVEATQECGRMFAGLARQLAGFESRLEAIEVQRATEARQTEFRVSVLEQRLLEVEAFAPWVTQVQQALEDFARVQAEEAAAAAAERERLAAEAAEAAEAAAPVEVAEPEPDPLAVMEPLLDELRREIAAADHREQILEARVAQLEALPSIMQDVAVDQFRKLAAELPGAPAELEGVYRELDSVAEQVARRDASVARGLQRLGPLEKYVDQLRDDLGRVATQLVSLAGVNAGVVEWMGGVDERMRSVESSGAVVERLRTSLDRMAGALASPKAAEADRPEPAAPPVPEETEEPSRRAIEVLTAELNRIGQSIDALSSGGKA